MSRFPEHTHQPSRSKKAHACAGYGKNTVGTMTARGSATLMLGGLFKCFGLLAGKLKLARSRSLISIDEFDDQAAGAARDDRRSDLPDGGRIRHVSMA